MDDAARLGAGGMNDQLVALVRTVVPAVVGLLLAAAAKANIDIDGAALNGVVDALVIGVYYVAVRQLEQRWPRFGVLLGIPKQPTYQPKSDQKDQ